MNAVDAIAQAIRVADGDHTMGAGLLAERIVASLSALGLAVSPADWEYALRDSYGHAWPYGERDEEEGTSLEEIALVSTEDWWESETQDATLHRRIKSVPAGPWEEVSGERS